ncbi:5'/3'-nucleotidase SurE [Candidatus Paracaedibacter symbiosus]|uniref:5'/3'-nucleotidase SurE n=1 Tax=Candidatus Paracaedibacter symbiosus TaxID=244582 RepID=UPI0005098C54|nr:5'/3'-nucleotidase SurE [Candidatus Paracaedibacter symbiosus]
MRILLSNDDGILGPGLSILEKIARTLSDDVWVIAPELDQSGASHSLTLRDPLRIREISEKRFAINGTPTDCVMIGVNHLMKDVKPDVVLSGVNYGANLAEDITYSGTVAAAMEATLLGIPSIALSQVVNYGHPAHWATAEHHAPTILKQLLNQSLASNVLININFPNIAQKEINGIRLTTQGQRQIEDELEERTDPRGKKYYWIGAINYNGMGDRGTDLEAIAHNYISVTPLTLDLTHYQTLEKLENVFC